MTDYIDVTNLMAQPIKSMVDITGLCLELQKENQRLQDIVDKQRDGIKQLSELLLHPGITYIKAYIEVSKQSLSRAVTYSQQKESEDIMSDIIKEASHYIKEVEKALSLTATEKDTKK